MKTELILAIINKIGSVNGGWTEYGWRKQFTKEDAVKEIAELFEQKSYDYPLTTALNEVDVTFQTSPTVLDQENNK